MLTSALARSDFLPPTCASTWLVVPRLIAPCVPRNVPVPIATACVSLTPANTGVDGGSPSSAATAARNAPARALTGTELGQLARVDAGQLDQARVVVARLRSRLSVSSSGKAVQTLAVHVPVSLAMMKSTGSRYL